MGRKAKKEAPTMLLVTALDGTFNKPLQFIPQWSDELCGDGRHCRVGTKGSDDTS